MGASLNLSWKRYALFILGVLLLLLGGLAIYAGSRDYLIRSAGIVVVMVSIYLIRVSHVHRRATTAEGTAGRAVVPFLKRPGRLAWGIALGLVPVLAIAYFLLHEDALHGGRTGWQADFFFGVAMACAVVWSYVFAVTRRGR